MNSDLYDHPTLYDALLPVGTHLPYYAELARQASGDILELASGTGQLTLPLASSGLRIAGLDLSEPMLRIARERAAAANVSVEYVLGDIRNFSLDRQFALILIARNSLLHLHSTEDILATFAMVRRHLAVGGIFAFDIFNPNVRLLARPVDERFPVFQVETESFGKLSVEETTDYDPATGGPWSLVRFSSGKAGCLGISSRASKHFSAGVAAASRGWGLSPQESRGRPISNAVRFQ